MSDYSDIKIEAGIPIPAPSKGGRGRKGMPAKLAKFRIGDSAFFPNEETGVGQRFVELMSARVSSAGLRLGMKFSCRTVTEGVEGVRVWRIK